MQKVDLEFRLFSGPWYYLEVVDVREGKHQNGARDAANDVEKSIERSTCWSAS